MVIVIELDIPSESVIELLSHRDNRASRIVSPFTVGDSDDESQTQREEDLRSCMDTASGADVPEATILDRVIGSFNTTPAVIRLVARCTRSGFRVHRL